MITLLGMSRPFPQKLKQLWLQLITVEQFHLTLWFPSKIITDQGRNVESELIENLCQVARVKKVRTSHYHPQTNGQCEHLNSTFLNMLALLIPEQKKDWKSHVPALCSCL